MLFYTIGTSKAIQYACSLLHKHGFQFTDHPCPEITHLILDVPSFRPDGMLRSGEDIKPILSMIPPTVQIIGGNLNISRLEGYRKTDLLQDPFYLAMNAEITADCALRLSAEKLDRTFRDSPALVIGWGRIGKCLARKLRAVGCPVSIAARKESDRAMIDTLGYQSVSLEELPAAIKQCYLIFNTIPAPLPISAIPEGSLAYELASKAGLPLTGSIAAKGLPGVMAPYSSGMLISQTIMRLHKEDKL